ncbi:synaptogyrin 1 [Phyllostomus discolor]|uniref:Synaptogyrin 1 n=1 Tax=Phyllostomus discolor TaxID=89673 RepID=A0A834EIC8_9CHIR|nr:synaptogyrin 1 [Phyllostomus discolor]
MEGGAYGAGKAGGAFDPHTLVRQPHTILRVVSWVFSIVVFGSIVNEGYLNTPSEGEEFCIYNRNPNACSYGVAVGVLAFLTCLLYLALDVYFPQISSVKDRKKAVLSDIGVSGRPGCAGLPAVPDWRRLSPLLPGLHGPQPGLQHALCPLRGAQRRARPHWHGWHLPAAGQLLRHRAPGLPVAGLLSRSDRLLLSPPHPCLPLPLPQLAPTPPSTPCPLLPPRLPCPAPRPPPSGSSESRAARDGRGQQGVTGGGVSTCVCKCVQQAPGCLHSFIVSSSIH